MKTLKFLFCSLAIYMIGFTPTFSQEEETPCITCLNEDETECQRVITPSGPHIFYGPSEPCED